MAKFITHLDVSTTDAEEQNLQAQHFNKINVDLNEGTYGHPIFIWYRKEKGSAAVTRVQVTFNDDMAVGLINAGYIKINKNLNAGARGDVIYMWYFRGSTDYDTPITTMDVTTEAQQEALKFRFGWERLACDLNRGPSGKWIHAWVKREKQTYICDVAATDSYGLDTDYFQEGYIRVDEDTNRGAGGNYVFLWYRQTTDPKIALTNLQVSINDSQYNMYQQQDYHSVSVNLNEGTRGDPVYLWYKLVQYNKPVKAISLLLNSATIKVYEQAGINVIKKNLNTGNNGSVEYLAVNQ